MHDPAGNPVVITDICFFLTQNWNYSGNVHKEELNHYVIEIYRTEIFYAKFIF